MRLLSVRSGFLAYAPSAAKWRATVLLLVVTLLIARASLPNPPTPAAAQGTVPTATATPDPTVVPTAPSDVHDAQDQLGGLFSQIEGDPPPSSDVETLASRLVGIDFGQLANAIESPVGPKDPVTGIPQTPHKLVLNLFADVVLTGIVEYVEPTASGHALWGGLEGVELGTMTLVVNGSVVVGTVRTPDAVYTIRTAAGGAYVVRQIDESSLPPLGEPLRGSIPEPDSPPPVRPQIRGPDAPDGTSTPTSTPTPVPTVPTSPSKPAPDEAMASGLFSEVEGDPPPSSGVDTLASRLVGIDFEQLASVTNPPVGPKDPVTGKPTDPQTLVLNLFDDVVFTGIVEHVEPTASGHALWGRLDGVELGTLTLVVNGSVVVGTVRTLGAVYTIRTAGDGTYVIRQIDESSLPPLGEPFEPTLSPRDATAETDDLPPDDGSVIDVMVVYTPLAKHREGGRAAIEALIDLMVAETNQAYENSGVIHRTRLVLREEVEYIEDGNSGIDLSRLRRDSDGYMDHIHELRNVYAADLVHIVVGRGNVGGQAASVGGDESSGFALSNGPLSLVFAHELGHNMGLDHDRYEVGVPVAGSHYGYVNQRAFEPGAPESSRWRTIMAYNVQCWDVAMFGCSWILYFSNPEVTYNGDPMGVSVESTSRGVDGPADAARTLNDRREITANFRRSSTSPTPRVGLTLSPYWLSENGGVSSVKATLHRPSSGDTVLTVSASPEDAISLSANRTLTIPAGQTVSDDTVMIAGVNNGDQTGDVTVTVSATATNTSDLGVIPPDSVVLAVVDDETTPVMTLSLSPAEVFEGGDRRERQTLVTTSLDYRSSVETTVTLSASPAEAVEEIHRDTLTIPAGQLVSDRLAWLIAVDDTEFTEAKKMVTVSGTATNSLGVTGPRSVTLTVIDDDAPVFADDSIAFIFTAGVAGLRFLPEADFGNGPLTYSISPALSNSVTFTPGPPARIGVNSTAVASAETSFTLTATDAEGDTGTMAVNITVREGVCPNRAAVSGYSDPEIVRDCEALLVSRHVLGGEQLLNWGEDLSMGEWQGVSIADNRVVEVDAFNLGLAGSIPSELGSLANLQELRLGWNELTGPIPPELGDLSKLKTLRLDINQLTGPIPSELDKLSQLSWLGLAQNQLSGGIPVWLGGLSNLQDLGLGWNQLTGDIPAEIGGLDKLQRLDLDLNPLSGGEIPVWLGGLSNLQTLGLHSIQLTGAIPPELGDLDKLRELDLAGNQLTGPIPSELGNLSQLLKLSLGHNELSGEVPAWLSDLSNLRQLALSRNQLTGNIPPELGDLTNLLTLQLANNQLAGPIPSELGKLYELISLSLSDNLLTGSIPSELGDLASLTFLGLSGNELTGCIPNGLRDVEIYNLDRLGLPFCDDEIEQSACSTGNAVPDAANSPGLVSDCDALLAARDTLAGTATLNWSVDTPITDWTGIVVDGTPGRVIELHLNRVGLTGEIPIELGSLSNLRYLNLSDNRLTGGIPMELVGLVNLQSLYLVGNRLTGCVPDGFRDVPNNDIARLGLSFCSEHPCVSGGAVVDVTNDGLLSDCETLLAARDVLAGTVTLNWSDDISIANWSGVVLSGRPGRVTAIHLSWLGLTGEIPAQLGNLSNLVTLRLSANQLTGEIPKELENLMNLEDLSLGSNQLTGEIPKELGSLTNLVQLSLGSNQLDSEIPKELGSLSNLERLFLHTNQLTGEIPPELGHLSNLESLGLSSTQLTGPIPPELGHLSNLTYLYLADNGLTGEIPPELGGLSNLESLGLSSNQLTGGIPTELGKLSNLQGLYLLGNRLTGRIPTELGKLSNLQQLLLSSNQLTGEIPTELGNLSNLRTLWLQSNKLTGRIPTELGKLSNLQSLYLRGNQFTGEIPTELGNLSNLQSLNLGWNQLNGGIPAVLGNLSYLQSLHLSNNQLTGEIPTELGNLLNLRSLNLRNNQFTGEIPTELGRLTGLTHLTLNDNDLEGSIPASLGSLTNLERLWLSNNRLTGCVPPRLQSVPHNDLEQLRLPICPLSPPESPTVTSVTSKMGSLTISWAPPSNDGGSDVTAYDLRHIKTDDDETVDSNWTVVEDVWTTGSGTLEYTLTGLTTDTQYDIQVRAVNAVGDGPWSATVTATLTTVSTCAAGVAVPDPTSNPGLVSDCESLLTLLDTLVEGTVLNWSADIPISEWDGIEEDSLEGTPPQVVRLYLGGLGLDGAVPSELSGLTELKELYLQDNDLSGPVPVELGDLSSLTHLHLQNNDLTGGIPAELGDLAVLRELRLDSNDLTGQLPPELGSLIRVTRLWVADNDLSGSIPAELGDMANLDWLNLGRNNFSGQIPAELGKLSRMRRLYIYENDLSGAHTRSSGQPVAAHTHSGPGERPERRDT